MNVLPIGKVAHLLDDELDEVKTLKYLITFVAFSIELLHHTNHSLQSHC